ncbi:cardiolipin synthase [Desulfonatronum sp. SC1]|uniref:cardiolipin synthase n=1 Tax=Desulfonatronum sp. SC1 TaxID=2109626 RepID=UPI000D313AC2|nr:cardiolipin synthase [Desulfonatronum sp. SC1]PTN35336.1 cardiolipin synthase [Desulfonatronum sp. SC1]
MHDNENGCPGSRRPLVKRKSVLVAFIVIIMHALGFLTSINALMSTRTAPGTVAWVVTLNTFPYVAVPAYWAFGRTKFQGYVSARREQDSILAEVLTTKLYHVNSFVHNPTPPSDRLQALERLAKMPFLLGNQLDLLIDGNATFQSIFEGIDAAEDYLLVQFYIVRADTLGQELKSRLIHKAHQGVRVFFLYDAIGSYRLPRSFINEMSAAGIHVRRFNSSQGLILPFQINFRNHRKIVVADGKYGWVGGFNVGDEYLGMDARFGDWRDTHLRISGPAVLGLQISFLEDWFWTTGEIPDLEWKPTAAQVANAPVLIFPSGPADRLETASLFMQYLIHTAKRRIWISSPYFVPDEGVMGALKLAALRGVDVRIVIPESPDHLLVYFATYAFLGSILDADIQIYRFQAGFLHGKAFVVDENLAGVGTINLDNRSFRLNFEVTAVVEDNDFTSKVEQMFERDFLRSRKMTAADIHTQPFWFRVVSRAAYLTAPLL